MRILDVLYKYPLIVDTILGSAFCGGIKLYENNYGYLNIYQAYDVSICSDLGSIGLTLSGFLITIVTILVSFKTSSLIEQAELKKNSNSFLIFISSPLYFQTVRFINKSVIILVLVSILNYLLKIFIIPEFNYVLFYVNVITVILILTTFIRSIYIIGLIIKMQKQ